MEGFHKESHIVPPRFHYMKQIATTVHVAHCKKASVVFCGMHKNTYVMISCMLLLCYANMLLCAIYKSICQKKIITKGQLTLITFMDS